MGPITAAERQQVQERSPLHGKYDQIIDRDSAHERLQARAQQAAANAPTEVIPARKTTATRQPRQGVGEALAKSVVRSLGNSLGRQIIRGVLGALFRGR